MLILIYLLSVFILYLIIREDIIKIGYKPTIKNLYKYYKAVYNGPFGMSIYKVYTPKGTFEVLYAREKGGMCVLK